MNVRIPVMVGRSWIRGNSKLPPEDSTEDPKALLFARHDGGLSISLKNRQLLPNQDSLDCCPPAAPPWCLEVKNARKAVAAVIVNAISAVMNCQYVCQAVSRDKLLELVRTPATRVIVQMIVSRVRQSVEASTNFWDHGTLSLQSR